MSIFINKETLKICLKALLDIYERLPLNVLKQFEKYYGKELKKCKKFSCLQGIILCFYFWLFPLIFYIFLNRGVDVIYFNVLVCVYVVIFIAFLKYIQFYKEKEEYYEKLYNAIRKEIEKRQKNERII